MIFDNIRSIRQYEGLGSNFQKAVQFLEALDLSRISQGDFEIDGRKVYAFANWITLKKPEAPIRADFDYVAVHIVRRREAQQ